MHGSSLVPGAVLSCILHGGKAGMGRSLEMFPCERRVPSFSCLKCNISIDARSQGKAESGAATNTSVGKAKQRQRLKEIPLLADENSSLKESLNRRQPAPACQEPKPSWEEEEGGKKPHQMSPALEQSSFPLCSK